MAAKDKNPVIIPRKMSAIEEKLIEKYAEDITAQSERMDRLAERLLTLELAVPGLFATALKLISGRQDDVTVTPTLITAFVCWFLALLFTLVTLIPRKWSVDEKMMLSDRANKKPATLSIRDYFTKVSEYKRKLFIPAALLFFLGIVFAVLTLS